MIRWSHCTDMRRPSTIIILVGLLASCSGALPSGPDDVLPELRETRQGAVNTAIPVADPIAVLLRADRFESARIGFGGTPSRFVDAWRHILASDAAASRFADLLRISRTSATRMYALTGLFAVNRTAFDSIVATNAWLGDS